MDVQKVAELCIEYIGVLERCNKEYTNLSRKSINKLRREIKKVIPSINPMLLRKHIIICLIICARYKVNDRIISELEKVGVNPTKLEEKYYDVSGRINGREILKEISGVIDIDMSIPTLSVVFLKIEEKVYKMCLTSFIGELKKYGKKIGER